MFNLVGMDKDHLDDNRQLNMDRLPDGAVS